MFLFYLDCGILYNDDGMYVWERGRGGAKTKLDIGRRKQTFRTCPLGRLVQTWGIVLGPEGW